MATVIQDFLETAPDGAAGALQMLAAAESLTDDVAREIYELDSIEGVSADLFVRALHYADFIVPRNSEWHFVPEVRQELQALDVADQDMVDAAHSALIRHGEEGDPTLAGSAIPGYLFTKAGKAYHKAALGKTDEALTLYATAAAGSLTGAQWLASTMADEQEARGVLPPGSIETIFLRAMVLFREGKRDEAEPLLRRVAETDEIRSEVAISCHVLAGVISHTEEREAERLFRKSINQKEILNDLLGQAHSLHSLANLIGRDRDRRDEAEELYQRSIEIGNEIGDSNGVAQTLRSLSFVVEHRSPREAEKLLEQSLELNQRARNRRGTNLVRKSLQQLRDRYRL